MARTKKAAVDPQLTKINKEIHEFTQFFYIITTQKMPDATQYASAYKMLKPLMYPNYEIGSRIYTKEELQSVVKRLIDEGIIVTINLLHYPSLIANIVDNTVLIDQMIKRIQLDQNNKYPYSDKELEELKPMGW
jgi:hypothetical protein